MAKKPAKPARKSPAKAQVAEAGRPRSRPARKRASRRPKQAGGRRPRAPGRARQGRPAKKAARTPAKKTAARRSPRKPAAKKRVAAARPSAVAKRKPAQAARQGTSAAKAARKAVAQGRGQGQAAAEGRRQAPQGAAPSRPRPSPARPAQPAAAVRPRRAAAQGRGSGAAAPAHKPTAGEIAARLAGKRAEDAASKKGKNGRHAEIAPRVLTPADVEARKRRLKTLIVLGKERGFLTYAEINDHLPDDILDAEQIEGIISMIGDMGIQVYDEAPDAETLLMSDAAPTAPAEDVEEEAEAAVSTLDSEFGRTTDPVRMYMREMGSVELLTREGEIEIAKRIEEGLKHMIMAISACPMTVAQILDLADKIEKDELKIDDLVDGLMDFNEELDALEDVDDDDEDERGRGRRRRDRRARTSSG